MTYHVGGPDDPMEPGYEEEWTRFHSDGMGHILESEWGQFDWLRSLVEILDAGLSSRTPACEVRLFREHDSKTLSIWCQGAIVEICSFTPTLEGVRQAEPVIWQKLAEF